MKTREVTSLALKLFSLYLLLEIFFGIPVLFGMYVMAELKPEEAEGLWLIGIGVAVILFAFVLAMAIWKLANRSLIESLKKESDSKVLKIVPNEIELIAFTIVGLYLVVTSLSSLLISLGSAYTQVNETLSFGIETESIVIIITGTVQLLLGVSLVVYPRKWSLLFARVRKG